MLIPLWTRSLLLRQYGMIVKLMESHQEAREVLDTTVGASILRVSFPCLQEGIYLRV
jgi:hypothetical protein